MLDIKTERGKETVAQELRAVEIIRSIWPDCEYHHTPKDTPAAVDAVITKWPEVVAVVETKCRNMTLNTLRDNFANTWLVTNEKLKRGKTVAELLQVQFWGILYLVPDDLVLRIKLWTPISNWLAKIDVKNTVTQRSVNGGTIARENAYIDMGSADVLVERIKKQV